MKNISKNNSLIIKSFGKNVLKIISFNDRGYYKEYLGIDFMGSDTVDFIADIISDCKRKNIHDVIFRIEEIKI